MEARSGKRSEEREDKLSLVRGADERGYGNEGLTATDPMKTIRILKGMKVIPKIKDR